MIAIPRRTHVADLLALAATVLATLASAAGLGVGTLYRDAPNWVQQARGIDLATLLLAAPILAIGLWTSRRGSSLGRLATVGGLLYLVYNYAIYSTAVAMNRLAFVYIAVLGLSAWSLVLILSSADFAGLARDVNDRLRRRTTAVTLMIVALLFALLWLSQIGAFTAFGTLPPDLVKAKLPANPVYALDLALFLPLTIVAGLGLLRRQPVGAAFALPMLIWLLLTSAGVVGGFLFIASAGEQVSVAVAAVIAAVGLLAAVLAAVPIRRARRDGFAKPANA